MPSILLPGLLLLGVAAWIAWPFLTRWRATRRVMVGADAGAPGTKKTTLVEQLCPQCGKINDATLRNCRYCEGEMPVDTILDLWKVDEERQEMIRELVQTVVVFAVLVLALTIAEGMSVAAKLVVILASLAIFGYRFLHRISGD